jgi:hypothetical protein
MGNQSYYRVGGVRRAADAAAREQVVAWLAQAR